MQEKPEDDPILTSSEVARVLGVSTSTAQLWMESGAIESWKTPGGHRRARRSEVLAVQRKMQPESHHETAPRQAEYLLLADETYPVGAGEQQRLDALAHSGLVDTEAEERFDRIVRLASAATLTPIALLSLLTARRQWFKARVGLEPRETPREWAFCSHAILHEAPFVVEDAALDVRFRGNPLVLAEPHIRFYAGVPVYGESGLAVGTLCVIDREPRKLRGTEMQSLLDLSEIATRELRSASA